MAPGFFTLSKTNSSSPFQLTLPSSVRLYIPSIQTHLLQRQRCHFSHLCPPFSPHLHVRYYFASTVPYESPIRISLPLFRLFSLLLAHFLKILAPGSIPRYKFCVLISNHFLNLCFCQYPDRNSAFPGAVPKLSFLCGFEVEWGLRRHGLIEKLIRSPVNCPRRQTRIRKVSTGGAGDGERRCRRFRSYSRLARKCLPMADPGLCHRLKILNGYELFWVCFASSFTNVKLDFGSYRGLFI